jgi:hypothetical protein
LDPVSDRNGHGRVRDEQDYRYHYQGYDLGHALGRHDVLLVGMRVHSQFRSFVDLHTIGQNSTNT